MKHLCQNRRTVAGLGPPTLKVIAGAALRQHLLNCCEAIKDAFVEHDHQLQPAGERQFSSHLVYVRFFQPECTQSD